MKSHINLFHVFITLILFVFCLAYYGQSYEFKPFQLFSEDENTIEIIQDRIQKMNPRIGPGLSRLEAEEIHKKSEKYGISVDLILACMYAESTFQPFSVSSIGARGLMQVRADIHKDEFDTPYQSWHIQGDNSNIDVGVRILKKYLQQTNSLYSALLKYVSGYSNTNNKVAHEYARKVCITLAEWHVDRVAKEWKIKKEKPKKKEEKVAEKEKPKKNIHTVEKGEYLAKIAKEHNTTVSKIKELNNLNSNTILPGQKLKIRK